MKKVLFMAIMPMFFSCSNDDNNSVSSISDVNLIQSTGYNVAGTELKEFPNPTSNPLYMICVTEQTMNNVKEYVNDKFDPENPGNYLHKVNFEGIDGQEYSLYIHGWNDNPDNPCQRQE